MPRAKRICAKPGCPKIVNARLCPSHKSEAEQARGSREARGYGYEHRFHRKQYLSFIEAGQVNCARCGELIQPGSAWALDHNEDRSGYLGPSHKFCNDSAGGKARHQ